MGLAYERAVGFSKDVHDHHTHIMICPRGSTRMEVSAPSLKKTFKIDSAHVLWVPKNVFHDDEGMSAIYDTLALFPSEDYFTAMIKDNNLTKDDREYLEQTPVLIKRTKWLDDIIDRYFFERVLNRHSPPGCTFFLEKQIINEFARIVFSDKLNTWITKKDVEEIGLESALRFIETNLFEKLQIEQICEVAKLSESSLLRYFKKELKMTPYTYIKERRLDEALKLLKSAEHHVGDIALLVGYEDFSAFSKAFKQRFGKTPSEYL